MRMRKRVLLALSCALASTSAGDVIIKTMSFNIRTSYAPEDRTQRCGNWDGERRGNVVAQIKAVDADFVGTQETSDEQKKYLDDTLKSTYLSIGKRSGSLNKAASEVNAVYYRTQSWKPLSDGMFWLGPNPDAPSADWGMKYYRTCTWGRFQSISSGKTVCILNTHFETPGNDLAQTKATEIILKRIISICQPSDSLTLILGDFNAKKNYPAMQKFFSEQWLDPSDDGTFCGNMQAPINACTEKFDFTLYRNKGGTCRLKSEVVRQSFGGCYPSDHAALVSTFCLDGECCGESSKKTQNSTTPVPPPSIDVRPTNTENNSSTTGQTNVSPGNVVPAEDRSVEKKPTQNKIVGVSDARVSNTSKVSSTITGIIVAIVCVMGIGGIVCVFVLKKRHAIDAEFDKSGIPSPSVECFSRSQVDALSPRASSHNITRSCKSESPTTAKSDSPIPTLEATDEDSPRSTACSWWSEVPMTERESSIAMLDATSDYAEESHRYGTDSSDLW